MAPTLPMAWHVVFLTVLYSYIREEFWREPISYLTLVLYIVRPARVLISLENPAAPLDSISSSTGGGGVRDQTTEDFPALNFHSKVRQSTSLGNLYLIECSNPPDH